MPELSDKEARVLRLLIDGASNREVMNRMEIGLRTVELYRSRIMQKLGARSPVHLGYLCARYEGELFSGKKKLPAVPR